MELDEPQPIIRFSLPDPPPSFNGVGTSTQVQPAEAGPSLGSPFNSQVPNDETQATIPWEIEQPVVTTPEQATSEEPTTESIDTPMDEDVDMEPPSFNNVVESTQVLREPPALADPFEIIPSSQPESRDASREESVESRKTDPASTEEVVKGSFPGESQVLPNSQLAYQIAAPAESRKSSLVLETNGEVVVGSIPGESQVEPNSELAYEIAAPPAVSRKSPPVPQAVEEVLGSVPGESQTKPNSELAYQIPVPAEMEAETRKSPPISGEIVAESTPGESQVNPTSDLAEQIPTPVDAEARNSPPVSEEVLAGSIPSETQAKPNSDLAFQISAPVASRKSSPVPAEGVVEPVPDEPYIEPNSQLEYLLAAREEERKSLPASTEVVVGSVPGESQIPPNSHMAYEIAAPQEIIAALPPLLTPTQLSDIEVPETPVASRGDPEDSQLDDLSNDDIIIPETQFGPRRPELTIEDIMNMSQLYPTQSFERSEIEEGEADETFDESMEAGLCAQPELLSQSSSSQLVSKEVKLVGPQDEEEEETQSIPPAPSFGNVQLSTQKHDDLHVLSPSITFYGAGSVPPSTALEASFGGVVTSTQRVAGEKEDEDDISDFTDDKAGQEPPFTPFQQMAVVDLSSPPTTPTRHRRRASVDADDLSPSKKARGPSTSPPVTTPSKTPRQSDSQSSAIVPVHTVREPRAGMVESKVDTAKTPPRTPTKAQPNKFLFALFNQPTQAQLASGPGPTNREGRTPIEETPEYPDSPFGTPTSSVPRPLVATQPQSSPPSMKKPKMGRFNHKPLVPESSGIMAMQYNSQFQIEDNVEAVSTFLKMDVWGDDEIEEF